MWPDDPSGGSISIDGKNMSDKKILQNKLDMSYKIYLFDDTIYENIIFGEDSEKVNVQKVNKVIEDSFENLYK